MSLHVWAIETRSIDGGKRAFCVGCGWFGLWRRKHAQARAEIDGIEHGKSIAPIPNETEPA